VYRLANGGHLILEIKGRDTQQNRTKRAFLDDWVKAVNNHGGFGKWRWAVSFHPSDLEGILNDSISC
jgi:type III restriction enzyme